MRRFRRWVILLCLTIGLAVFGLHLPPVQGLVWELALARLREAGLEVSASRFSFDLLGPSVRIAGLSLGLGDPSRPRLLTVMQAEVHLSWSGLLTGALEVERASFDGVALDIEIDREGQPNWPIGFGGRGSDDPFVIPDTGTFRVGSSGAEFRDLSRGLGASLPAWTLTGASAAGVLELTLEIAGGGRAEAGARGVELGPIRSDLALQSDRLEVRAFSLASDVAQLDIEGEVSLSDPEFALDVEADLDLSRVSALVEPVSVVTGRVRTTAHLSGSLENLDVAGTVLSANLTLPTVDSLSLQGDWSWNRAEPRFRVSDLDVVSEVLSARVSGDLGLGGNESRFEAAIDLDLGRLGDRFDLPVGLAGRARGEASARWPGLDWPALEVAARLDVERLPNPARPSALPLAGRLSLEGGLGRVGVSLDPVGVPELDARGLVNIGEDGRLSGEVVLASSDTAALIERVSRALDGGSPLRSATLPRGRLSGEVRLGGSVSDPEFVFALETPGISWHGIEDVGASTEGRFRSNLLDLESVSVDWMGAAFEARGTVDFAVPSPGLELALEARDLSLPAVLTALDLPQPLRGRFALSAAIGGSFEAPQVAATVSASGLAFRDQPLGGLEGRVELDRTQVELVSFDWSLDPETGAAGVVEGRGRYEFGEYYALVLNGDSLVIADLTSPGLGEVRGGLSFALDAEGPIDDPGGMFEVSGTGIVVGDWRIGDVSVSGELIERALALEVSVPDYLVTARGRAGLGAPYPISARLEAPGFDLATLAPLFGTGPEVAGRLAGTVSVEMDLAAWEDARVSLELDSARAAFDGAEITTDGRTVIRYENRRIRVERLELLAQGQRLSVAGNLPMDSEGSTDPLRIDGAIDLEALRPLLPAPFTEVSGTALVEVTLAGSLGEVRPDAAVALRGVSIGLQELGEPIRELDADLALEGDVLRLDNLRARWNGGLVEASGTLPFGILRGANTGETADLDLRVSNLEVEGLDRVPSGFTGLVGARIRGATRALVPEAIEARLEVEQFDVAFNGLAFVQEVPIAVTLSAGRARLMPFRVIGPETRLEGEGEVSLLDDREIRAEVRATTDTLVLASASGEIVSSGRLRATARVDGPLAAPSFAGNVFLEDAELYLADPAVEVAGLEASLTLTPGRLVVETLSGSLNGGRLSVAGSLGYRGFLVTDARLELAADGVFLEAPEGLQTLSNARIGVRSDGALVRIEGEIQIVDGAYSRDIALDRLLLEYVRGSTEALPADPNPLLSPIRFDVGVETIDPVIVENNVARLAAQADLQLVGSYYRPGLLGRISFEEGGTVQIRENRFLIDRGTVDFTSPNRIEPSIALVARTEVGGENITLQIDGGGAGELDTTLSSDSGLSEPNIVSLLLTGRRLDQVRGAELNVAQEQALSYITGSLGGALSRSAERALGFSRVRVEPNLIASESDPGARLTIGQDITRSLELIYSMNLADSGDQIVIAEYDFDRGLVTRGVRQEDNTYRFELRHDLAFGIPSTGSIGEAIPEGRRRDVREVRITPPDFDGHPLAGVFGIDSGSRYDFFELRGGTGRLEEFFAGRGYLEARVRSTHEDLDGGVLVSVQIDPGPSVEFEFAGAQVSRSLSGRVREVWRNGGFDRLRMRNATDALTRGLIGDGYLQTEISASESLLDLVRHVRFEIRPGPRYRRVEVSFPGASAVSPNSLRSAIREADLESSLHADSERVRQFLEQWYRAEGYLDASIGTPRYEFDAQRSLASLLFPIEEGPLYRVSRVSLEGNVRVEGDVLRRGMPAPGPIRAQWVDLGERHLEERYWELGYNDVRIATSVLRQPGETPRADVVFRIDENERSIVEDIEVAGNRSAGAALALGQIDFAPGDPLDYTRLNESRRAIYQTGLYSLVQIDTSEVAPFGAGETPDRPVRVRFDVEEVPPYSLRYGGFYDNERGPGAIADLENRGLVGGAWVIGVRTRFDRELREARFYLTQPALRSMPFATSLTGFLRSDDLPDETRTRSRGISLQQETRIPGGFRISYGYRFERRRTVEIDPEASDPVDIRLDLAPLTFSLSRDTRDDPFDGSNGSFTSHAIEYAASGLGSDVSLLRYFGQFFKYVPLSEPDEVPLSGGLMKPRWVFATGVRVGLVSGLGSSLVRPSERFFVGGGTTIRGFPEDRVGPLDAEGLPLGGQALLVLNNELRFPLFSLLEGVAFADAGNVYSGAGGFDLFDLRTSGGFGLRLRTPYFLLRTDYGFSLDRRVGEKPGAFFFSIGQAF